MEIMYGVLKDSLSRVFLLLLQVEAHADAIVVFTQVADGAEGGVATHGTCNLKGLQKFLRLEKQTDAFGVASEIACGGDQECLQFDDTRLWVVVVGAADGLAVYLTFERIVLFESEVGV